MAKFSSSIPCRVLQSTLWRLKKKKSPLSYPQRKEKTVLTCPILPYLNCFDNLKQFSPY